MDAVAVFQPGGANRLQVPLLRAQDEDVFHGMGAPARRNASGLGSIYAVAVLDARTDVVGSLLRPPELLEARRRLEAGELSTAAFKQVEDRAVDEALALQEKAGLDVVTDGEMRRLSFQSQVPAAVDGFGEWDLDAFLWGEWHSDELGDLTVERPPIAAVAPLRRRRSLSGEEFAYARGRTDRVLKVTLPSPSLFANFYDPERSRDAYPTLEAFLGDVAEILREEVEELVGLGATYIQLDAPHYPLLLDEAYRAFYESRGWPAERWLDLGSELDNLVMGDHPGRDLRLPPLPWEPGEPLARRRRLRLARRAALRPNQGAATPARVRRRALRGLRAAGTRRRGCGLRARARDDEDAQAGDGRRAGRPDPGRPQR